MAGDLPHNGNFSVLVSMFQEDLEILLKGNSILRHTEGRKIDRDGTLKPRNLRSLELLTTSHHLTPQSADVILGRAETMKLFAIYLTYILDYFH